MDRHDADTEPIQNEIIVRQSDHTAAIFMMLFIIVVLEIVDAVLLGFVAYWMYSFIHL